MATLERRYWKKVQLCAHGFQCRECCWEWVGAKHGQGYGILRIDGKLKKSHRIGWELYNNRAIPDGWQINHDCNNTQCNQPGHLKLGTHADNTADIIMNGNFHLGSIPKLTEEEIEEVRTLYAAGGWSQRDLAREFSVTQPTINNVLNRKKAYYGT
jgi:hypothetical protein